MMTIRYSVSSPLLLKRPFTIKTPANKVLLVKMQMPTHNQTSFSKSSSQVQIRSFSSCTSTRNKIFEDASQGIVCYKDEITGETICEGYDEGPRICPTVTNSLQRDVEKSDGKKKKKMIQLVVNGGYGEGITNELDYTVVNWMDFNSLP